MREISVHRTAVSTFFSYGLNFRLEQVMNGLFKERGEFERKKKESKDALLIVGFNAP